MSARTIGLRYERLLFFAGPLSLLTLLVLFVAIATDQQEDRHLARCYNMAASAIAAHKKVLDAAWGAQIDRIATRQGKDYQYELAIQHAFIDSILLTNPRCYSKLDRAPGLDLYSAPDTLIDSYRKLSATVPRKPMSMHGVDMPEKATIGILGTKITVDLVSFSRALQIGLAPVLLLWLGSLYNTRHRESLHEPPRILRRLFSLRGLSHEEVTKVFS